MTKAKNLSAAALMTALTVVGALIRIPTPTAPITLQFFFTLTAGLLLGEKWGAVSQALYLLLGLIGLPVFTLGGGFSYVLQPTFGFLLGLIPASAVAGALRKNPLPACLLAWAALYAVGLPYLHFLLGSPSLATTLKTGLFLFLPGDALKIFVTALLIPKLQKALNQQKPSP